MSQKQSFTYPSYEGKSPLAWYREASQQEGFIADAAQERAMTLLDELWQAVLVYRQKNSSLFKKILFSSTVPKSTYMWGGVGRGKSFLMDTFYHCLPFTDKRRVHFHAFMSEFHQAMQVLKDQQDPLMVFAKQLAAEVKVLCFDEFHVSDIADALILGRLLESVLAQNVIIVATSNYKPDDLYTDGQNRYSFLPTIDLINQHFQVMNVDSGEDYRLRTLTDAGVFLQPDNESNRERLETIFSKLNQSAEVINANIEILGRELKVQKRTKTSIWFEFEALCAGPRSQEDYLKLAQQYYYVFISGIKKLDVDQKDIARRLTWLIDVFYDYRVKVCMTSEVAPHEIYQQGDFAQEFERTVSRMQEMQSEEYLNLPHLTLK